jgi:putative addiction module component (TIGR02574 family)
MSLQEIEQSALKLPETQRAKLAAQLLSSLPAVLADEDDGVAEALRRDAELDADPAQGMSLEDLDKRVERRRRSR